MDNLKKYLLAHKEEMDIDTPSVKLLQKIQQQTVPGKQSPVLKMALRYAAAACLLTIVIITAKYFLFQNKMEPGEIAQQNDPVKLIPGTFIKAIPDDTAGKNSITTVPENTIAAVKKQSIKAKAIDPSRLINSFENNYTQLVNLQLNNIRKTPVYAETQNDFNDFRSSLKQMDADEANVKASIRANGLNEQLLQQLINIYQEKLNMLKSLQMEINKINNRVKQNQLPTDTLTTHFINI